MRKILLGLVITGLALTLFITIKPQTANLIVTPEGPQSVPADQALSVLPVPYFEIVQGESTKALTIRNNTGQRIGFSLGHENPYVTFQPQGDQIGPELSREIEIVIDPECPVGMIDLPVYLRADILGERIGLETSLSFRVVEGNLSFEQLEGSFAVLWNGHPAPRGVLVYYRQPGESQWDVWGETPRVEPPRYLAPGDYNFEYRAKLGDVESPVALLNITVEEIIVKTPEPEPVAEAPATAAAQPVIEEEKEPEPPPIGTWEYLMWKKKMRQEAMKASQEVEEEVPEWWEF
ncbi:MAG: hypothetical protein SCJ97_03320 [Bacillota bacterium]|nr:hypothetical protein [Bacillota bacterium]